MSDAELVPAKVTIVPLRGKDRGKFGWVYRTDEFLLQCLKKFATRELAMQDAESFAESKLQPVH